MRERGRRYIAETEVLSHILLVFIDSNSIRKEKISKVLLCCNILLKELLHISF